MAQQTAVEWLMESIKNKSEIVFKHINEDGFFEQAKQMEKEQIMNSWVHGVAETNDSQKTAEQYYNETYGK